MKMKHSIIISIVSLLLISCSTTQFDVSSVETYRKLKSDLLKCTIDYFISNNIVDTTEYFTLLTYPYFLDFKYSDIENVKLHINSFAPFKDNSLPMMDKKNNLMIVDLQIGTLNNSIYSIVGVVHIDNDRKIKYFGFDYEFINNEWILKSYDSRVLENYYFFNKQTTK